MTVKLFVSFGQHSLEEKRFRVHAVSNLLPLEAFGVAPRVRIDFVANN